MTGYSACDSWFERHMIDDAVMGGAYEAVGPAGRASLKKCIARLYRIWGEGSRQERLSRRFADGFGLEREDAPAPFSLYLYDAAYASAAAYIAAVMPAVLAGVGRILPCFIVPEGGTQQDVNPDLLAGLELAGVEQAFVCAESHALELADRLADVPGRGRIVCAAASSLRDAAALQAVRRGIPFRVLEDLPFFYSTADAAVMAQGGALSAAGGQAEPCVCDVAEDAVLVSLDAEHADVWVWPDLDPAWFRNSRLRLFAL